ncbi:MAG: hypothetical protein GY839_21320 [candidate division Zixibacteria bacterium]|nr:hypothetical protein [candidate division Zixibacteria bacterium]
MDNTTLFLVIAAACPFICAIVARMKNKNPISWFCWGILFGVFAVTTVVILPGE